MSFQSFFDPLLCNDDANRKKSLKNRKSVRHKNHRNNNLYPLLDFIKANF
jgi:hypothetical protein